MKLKQRSIQIGKQKIECYTMCEFVIENGLLYMKNLFTENEHIFPDGKLSYKLTTKQIKELTK